eukprot:CAMPEP_0184870988 /NCGR_PEP_ID=MMETSP0580-20130426/39447_1 /TAXON_ID=1118495 /ORGANISM="Dactyliosolen fragilissimus" /LENGTH=1159 /DNA_ID=CAMNT_0027373403 /DNA_START=305 /DNA_END=3784 /DNA_ORIENTATION=+
MTRTGKRSINSGIKSYPLHEKTDLGKENSAYLRGNGSNKPQHHVEELSSMPNKHMNIPESSKEAPVAPKPCYYGKLALLCVHNAMQMDARTRLNLCPPGMRREDLRKKLLEKKRIKKNYNAVRGRAGLRIQRASSFASVGSRDESSAFDKVLGDVGMRKYDEAEDLYLKTPVYDLNSDGEEVVEDPSSGDEDPLDLIFEDGDTIQNLGKSSINQKESLYTLGSDTAASSIQGGGGVSSASSGKIPFNLRKLRWFDTVTANDRIRARKYLQKEVAGFKKKDAMILMNHLKKLQKIEKKKLEMELGRKSFMKLKSFESSIENSGEEILEENPFKWAGISSLPDNMTPSLSAALVLESLTLNPVESMEGMAKCYEGIVAAGTALLESEIDDTTSNSGDVKKPTKTEILNALTPLLITNLNHATGETILGLSKLRKFCGTKRYQRRFVQRIGPSLVRPPSCAMWCLRHQTDMEAILAATEMIFDHAFELFSTGWHDHGRTILADSHRAETLEAAAAQLKNLSSQYVSEVNGLSLQGTSRRTSNRFVGASTPSRDSSHTKAGGKELLAEWEILAVDIQIRQSISNFCTKSWSRTVFTNAPLREGDPATNHVSRPRGISASRTKSPVDLQIDTSAPSSTPVSSPARKSKSRKTFTLTSIDPQSSPTLSKTQDTSPNPPISTRISDLPNTNIQTSLEFSDVQGELSKPVNKNDVLTPPHTPKQSINQTKTPPLSPTSPPPTYPNQQQVRNGSTPPLALHPEIAVSGPQSSASISAELARMSLNPAPLSPPNLYAKQEQSNQSVSTSTSSNDGARSNYLRSLTSTAAERKRTVAACRALRAQISRFEDAFFQIHGRQPKGADERRPLATTYAQYREWKRAIRADAAGRIQALCRGWLLRRQLQQSENSNIRRLVSSGVGRPGYSADTIENLSIPVVIDQVDTRIALDPSVITSSKLDEASSEVEVVIQPPIRNTAPSGMSLAELQVSKRDLKHELKQYDVKFYQKHGRMPMKVEKEPIRHLYESYNALKSRISSLEREGKHSSPQPNSLPHRRPSSIPANNITGNDAPPGTPIPKKPKRPDSIGLPPDNYQRQIDPSGQHESISRDLQALKDEKQALHQKLRAYEKDFYRTHNKQVSSYDDIRPVAQQYRRYKEIKKQIAALQGANN